MSKKAIIQMVDTGTGTAFRVFSTRGNLYAIVEITREGTFPNFPEYEGVKVATYAIDNARVERLAEFLGVVGTAEKIAESLINAGEELTVQLAKTNYFGDLIQR